MSGEEFEEFDQPEEGEERKALKPKFTGVGAARRRVFLSFFYGMQGLRMALSNALGGLKRAYPQYSEKEMEADEERFLGPAKKHENEFMRILKGLVDEVPIAKWLVTNVRGVAWSLAGQLVAIIGEINLFQRVSNLWSYAGLKPGDRRRAGVKANWNPELKRCLYNFAVSAIKSGGFYAEGYAHYKAKEERKANDLMAHLITEVASRGGHKILDRINEEHRRRHEIQQANLQAKVEAEKAGRKAPAAKPFSWEKWKQAVIDGAVLLGFNSSRKQEGSAKILSDFEVEEAAFRWLASHFNLTGVPAMTPVHRHARAMRKIEKLLLQHIWVKWRELEGLPVSEPWVFDLGEHDRMHLILPPDSKDAEFPMHLAA